MLLIFTIFALSGAIELFYDINDGTKSNSYIGNLPQDAGISIDSAQDGHFSIVMGGEYLKVNPKNGDLRTADDIDREKICTNYDDECLVDIEVIITPRALFQLFKVQLRVIDLNDNAPKFPSEKVSLEIAEDAQIGSLIRLDSASDADSAKFGVGSYYIKEVGETWEKYFELETEKIDENTLVPKLKLVNQLDYEQKKVHDLVLIARDKGNPPFEGKMEVRMNVLDVNDHAPVFPQSRYSLNVSELSKSGQLITRITATDGDSGENGRLTYGYSSLVPDSTKKIFPIDPATGEIRVGKNIDFENAKKYQLYIEVHDNGPNPKWAYCSLTITVIDANDNPPEIEVSFVGSDSPDHELSENVEIGSFVAFVSVSDSDLGESGRVDTQLEENPDFELEPVGAGSNRFILKTKAPLDRERTSSYDLTVRSRDHGVPPLESAKVVQILVSDINDNAPSFPHSEYDVTMSENNQPGVKVTGIRATDPDEGKNSEIHYFLQDNHDLFKIDEETGEIFAKVALDAEKYRSGLFLHIKAVDSGTPQLSGNTAIRLKIKDENDNRPVFDKRIYSFRLSENQPVGTIVGKISASDRDENNKLDYLLKDRSIYFRLDKNTGELTTIREIDHERDPTLFDLTILACDLGKKCDTARLTISILDINDNAPEIISPRNDKQILPLLLNETSQDSIIWVIRSRDLDSGEAGRITCSLEGKSKIFLVSPDCRIALLRELTEDDLGLLSLRVKASDNGFPSVFTTRQVNFALTDKILNSTQLAQMENQIDLIKSSPLNAQPTDFLMILVGSATAFILIAAILTTVVCNRRRRPRGAKSTLSPRAPKSRRDEEVDWRMEVTWQKPELVSQSDHDSHSWVDSGAGESISEPDTHKSPVMSSRHFQPIKKPSFKTFVDDPDERCSVEIFDHDQYVPSYYS